MKLTGICSKCLRLGELYAHYIIPQHHHGKNETRLFLCSKCDKEIKDILPSRKLTRYEYISLTKAWMRGVNVTVL